MVLHWPAAPLPVSTGSSATSSNTLRLSTQSTSRCGSSMAANAQHESETAGGDCAVLKRNNNNDVRHILQSGDEWLVFLLCRAAGRQQHHCFASVSNSTMQTCMLPWQVASANSSWYYAPPVSRRCVPCLPMFMTAWAGTSCRTCMPPGRNTTSCTASWKTPRTRCASGTGMQLCTCCFCAFRCVYIPFRW